MVWFINMGLGCFAVVLTVLIVIAAAWTLADIGLIKRKLLQASMPDLVRNKTNTHFECMYGSHGLHIQMAILC